MSDQEWKVLSTEPLKAESPQIQEEKDQNLSQSVKKTEAGQNGEDEYGFECYNQFDENQNDQKLRDSKIG